MVLNAEDAVKKKKEERRGRVLPLEYKKACDVSKFAYVMAL